MVKIKWILFNLIDCYAFQRKSLIKVTQFSLCSIYLHMLSKLFLLIFVLSQMLKTIIHAIDHSGSHFSYIFKR